MSDTHKVCSVFGHRKIEITDELKTAIMEIFEKLINIGVDAFLFGSQSVFDTLCWEAVTELKKTHSQIKRISYTAPHEYSFTSREEREQAEKFMSEALHQEVKYTDYEETLDVEKAYKANRNAYIMRNQGMIDNSNVCVFYYDKNYLPPRRKCSKRNLLDYQPKSGTGIAYAYAKQKKKEIINIFEMINHTADKIRKVQLIYADYNAILASNKSE